VTAPPVQSKHWAPRVLLAVRVASGDSSDPVDQALRTAVHTWTQMAVLGHNKQNPEQAIQFYQRLFAWEFHKWDGPMDYWLITTGTDGEGINGGLTKRDAGQMSLMNTIDVPSVDDYLERITRAGGKVTMPKDAIPGVGWFAAFHDTEGNHFGIMQPDETATSK